MSTSEKQSAPEKQAGDALQSLLQRIGDVFGLFDLSFFVAGAVCLGALAFGGWLAMGTERFIRLWPAELKVLHVVVGAVTGYVLGIVCFALGRMISRRTDFYKHLKTRLNDFTLHDWDAPLDGKKMGASELYTMLWVELRQNKELGPSFNLLLRYWVMAAMCDGLSVAFGVWTLAWLCWMAKHLPIAWLAWAQPASPPVFVELVVLVLLVGATLLCGREGRRYAEGQMTELLATLAHHRGVLAKP